MFHVGLLFLREAMKRLLVSGLSDVPTITFLIDFNEKHTHLRKY